MRNRYVSTLTVVALLLLAQSVGAEVDREKLLKDTGVYATFAVFKVGDRWWAMDLEARAGAVADVKTVFQKHSDKITVDTHLLRGLSEKSDFMIRIHSREMVHNQNFLLDFMSTTFGKALHNTDTFNGITKALNYVPSFPEELKGELKTPRPRTARTWWLSLFAKMPTGGRRYKTRAMH